ncbi:MAG: toxin-antitoxin system [Myxococcota bacterium]
MANVTMGVKLERETRDRLKSLGRLKERTPHFLVKKAIDEYLEREERWEAEKKEDQERWEEFATTGESVSLQEVTKMMRTLRSPSRRRRARR